MYQHFKYRVYLWTYYLCENIFKHNNATNVIIIIIVCCQLDSKRAGSENSITLQYIPGVAVISYFQFLCLSTISSVSTL